MGDALHPPLSPQRAWRACARVSRRARRRRSQGGRVAALGRSQRAVRGRSRPARSRRAAPTRAGWRAGQAGTLTISASTRPPSPASSWRRSWAAPGSAPPAALPARGRLPPLPPRRGRPGAQSAAGPSVRPPC